MIRLRKHPLRVGLALSGGGARGGIHIGVLKVLEAKGIPIHCVAGTSIGALIGALYSLTLSAEAVEQRLHEYLESDTFRKARFNIMAQADTGKPGNIFTRIASFIKKEFLLSLALSRPYLISKEHFLENLAFFLPDVRMEDTRIPFAAVATDLETGEQVAIRQGSIREAVYASCTFPGVIEAVRLDGRLLVDGGVIAMVPVQAARDLGSELVIGVNAERCVGESIDGLSGIEIIFRADDIMAAELTRCQTQDADVMIHPGLGDTKWYDLLKTPDYISIGQEATERKLPEIRKALRRGWMTGFLRGFQRS